MRTWNVRRDIPVNQRLIPTQANRNTAANSRGTRLVTLRNRRLIHLRIIQVKTIHRRTIRRAMEAIHREPITRNQAMDRSVHKVLHRLRRIPRPVIGRLLQRLALRTISRSSLIG